MKNKDGGKGGLNREGGLINFPPLKRGGLFERGGLTEDLRYVKNDINYLCSIIARKLNS